MDAKPRFIRFLHASACAALLAAGATPDIFAQQDQKCSDSIPSECKTVRPLGEISGCACFVCNPDKSNEQTVCSQNPRTKEELLKRPRA